MTQLADIAMIARQARIDSQVKHNPYQSLRRLSCRKSQASPRAHRHIQGEEKNQAILERGIVLVLHPLATKLRAKLHQDIIAVGNISTER